jgi:hypothetical protein
MRYGGGHITLYTHTLHTHHTLYPHITLNTPLCTPFFLSWREREREREREKERERERETKKNKNTRCGLEEDT